MRALIADDDGTAVAILSKELRDCGLDVVCARDGAAAWRILTGPERPQLAILDWIMPALEGPQICRRVRGDAARDPMYLILVSARETRDDVMAGLEAGADDYVAKPFDRSELRARVKVGMRIISLQSELAARAADLQSTLSQLKQLRGLIPICSYCKRIRGDGEYWHQIEQYIAHHSEAQFSHGICPECADRLARGSLQRSSS